MWIKSGRIRPGLILGLLAAVVALGAAGCGGGGGDDGVATAGGGVNPSAGTEQLSGPERALKFSQCVRDNGVPNFPDPKISDGGGIGMDVPDGTDPARVEAATKKCREYLPNGGEPQKLDPERLERLRQLAKCMRENGVPEFPDPTENGIQVNGNTSGLDPKDPIFQAAEKVCDKYGPSGGEGKSNESGSEG